MIRNLERIREDIEKACLRANRKPEEVKVLGASKGQGEEKLRLLYDLGMRIFGENYVQEAEGKIKNLGDLNIDWHFIGRLQTNKAKKAVLLFSTIHSLDRLPLAQELDKRARALNKTIKVLVEVNLAGEKTKGGVAQEEVEEFVEKIKGYSRLRVVGLMCLPPLMDFEDKTRKYFQGMKRLFDRIKPSMGEEFVELSMGTSSDFVIAVEEGATIVRIGTLLFGPRL